MFLGPATDRPLAIAALSHRVGVHVCGPDGTSFTLTPEAARETLTRLEVATRVAEMQAAETGNVVHGRFACIRPFAVRWQAHRSKAPGPRLISGMRLIITLTLAPVLIAAMVVLAIMGTEYLVGEVVLRQVLPLCLLAAVVLALGLTWLGVPLLLETRRPHPAHRVLTLVKSGASA